MTVGVSKALPITSTSTTPTIIGYIVRGIVVCFLSTMIQINASTVLCSVEDLSDIDYLEKYTEYICGICSPFLDIDSNKLQECMVPYTPNHGYYSAVAVEVFLDYRNYRTAIHASPPGREEAPKKPSITTVGETTANYSELISPSTNYCS